ncbi:MAG: DUF1499 domain-containing protein [Bdellovibrionales bacterium]|nr:DUF1499 domain-containing protein [Bdellovibrionales bacterium]
MFKPCPPSPNCVNSQQTEAKCFIEPLQLVEPYAQSWQAFVEFLQRHSEIRIQNMSDTSIGAIAVTLFFRFVDDVQFELDQERGKVDMRSASRLGYYDLGKNRKRLENLRSELLALGIVT